MSISRGMIRYYRYINGGVYVGVQKMRNFMNMEGFPNYIGKLKIGQNKISYICAKKEILLVVILKILEKYI